MWLGTMSMIRPMPCSRRAAAIFSKAGIPPSVGIELVGVGHVVAVRRVLPRREGRGEVEVADAQPVEIGHQPLGIGEPEAGAELEAVGGVGMSQPWGRSSLRAARRALAKGEVRSRPASASCAGASSDARRWCPAGSPARARAPGPRAGPGREPRVCGRASDGRPAPGSRHPARTWAPAGPPGAACGSGASRPARGRHGRLPPAPPLRTGRAARASRDRAPRASL